MKKILKILFAFLAPAWLAFSCAHAEEVEIVPSVTYELSVHSSYQTGNVDFTGRVYQEVPKNAQAYPFNQSNRFFGNYSDVGFTDTPIYIYSSSTQTLLQDLYSDLCAEYYVPSTFQDFSITFDGLFIGLDMTGNMDGYYRYSCDFGLGAFFVPNSTYYRQTTFDCTPSYTYNSVPLSIADSATGMHCTVYLVGETEWTTNLYQSTNIKNSLVKFHMESTFYYDSSYGSEIAFDLTPVFSSMIGSLNYDNSAIRSGGVNSSSYVAYNNRFTSSLFGNVEPPVTPTPSPTPSPNQDIINNDNTNTTNIISSINDGFDALSAVFEGAIYGLTDLFFGSASDWIDFFSDVQDDMEDYLPVVSFFQSCKNILANFFNVQSTDPTALQFVAGWQSDIYTLHIGALPLVLPEGTYNFFPEVNFDLNNPFMNEIRPYWLTFSNVLITLLFLRYLANYLFRWTQLLTGDTSVAFQLFHHAPGELENLGTDPYDLAGDYSYDSIDSENHDLYQDAEAHYGHGAARYLSKVFHTK